LWKKKELKASVEDALKKHNAQYPEKELDKIINGLTQAVGGG
jgi:hypothetical protein